MNNALIRRSPGWRTVHRAVGKGHVTCAKAQSRTAAGAEIGRLNAESVRASVAEATTPGESYRR